MPKKPTGGMHFTLPNKNSPNLITHIRGLFKDFHKPPIFSSTVKAMNLQLLNSSTFKDFQRQVGTLKTPKMLDNRT